MLQISNPEPPKTETRRLRRIIVLTVFIVFLFPVLLRASFYAFQSGPAHWRDANWSSTGLLAQATADPRARIVVMYARAGGLKGVVAVHSWIEFKRAHTHAWTRYDVAGWGSPVKLNNWPPDGRWYGTTPTIIADVAGAEAEALIPKIEAAVRDYAYDRAGDYRIWPGPNSNTFTATVLRAVPEIGAALPSNAIGRDFRPLPYAGLTGSRTGVELNLWGLLGLKVALVEGLEVNVLGLIAGFDWLHPAVKIPGFGPIGVSGATAVAAVQ
jgi:Protein of unknown function (DUF3750)